MVEIDELFLFNILRGQSGERKYAFMIRIYCEVYDAGI
jgi:hypothetical protein